MSSGEKASSQKFTKAEKSWILYDWANSVYATNIMAVLFPIYFGSVCAAAGADNLVLWSYGTSVATFITAVLAPILGSLADHKGHKKRLFVACLVLGVAFTLFSALTDDYRGLLVGYVISHIGFSGSCLFYDALFDRRHHPGAHGPGLRLGLRHGLHRRQHHPLYPGHYHPLCHGHGEPRGL